MYPLLHGQWILYLSTYTTFSSHPTGHLRSHKVVALPGPWSEHRRPQLTLILIKYPEQTPAPTKLPQQMSALGQISSTGVGTRSIISFCRCSSCSRAMIGSTQSEPRPNISNRRLGSNNLHQVESTSLARLQDYGQLSPTYTAVPQIVTNQRHNLMNYRQPTLEFLNPEL